MTLLSPCDYHVVREYLHEVDTNVLFAYSVINHSVEGKIFVDDCDAPTVFYIVHPYGMALLLGDTEQKEFNHALKNYLSNHLNQRKRPEWLQVYPRTWEVTLNELLNKQLCFDSVNEHAISVLERLNFEFSFEKYYLQKETIALEGNTLQKTDKTLYEKISGSVIPSRFWNNYSDFERFGVGFSLVDTKGNSLSTAFCSFIYDGQLELGIETDPRYLGKGYAYAVCSALIDYCLDHKLIPVWACSSLNSGSQKLAQKLGFSMIRKRPYYQLPNS